MAEENERLDRLLGAFLEGGPLDSFAPAAGCDSSQIAFFPRAFLQPFAEAAAVRDGEAAAGRDAGRVGEGEGASGEDGKVAAESGAICPWCGSRPQVAYIRDRAEVKGRNRLVCSFCAMEWDFPRSTCPSCLEAGPEVVLFHSAEAMGHVRIMECRRCKAYLKSVDLRVCGVAVPLVEDIATVELDVWSSERGLRKVQTNLLGL
jgi:hypothetical protein